MALGKRAFVAAPLIGTLIFLIAVVFSVNIVKTESAEVSKIANDAYHNKLVSLLELYRSDSYSLFVDGLRQNIEDWLVLGWDNLFSLSSGTEAERYANCVDASSIISQVLSSSTSVTNISNLKDYYITGLSDLLKEMRLENQLHQQFSFEGITFSSVSSLDPLTNCSGADYETCKKLVQGSVFDCNYFAKPNQAANRQAPFRCCTSNQTALEPFTSSADGGCSLETEQERGCETGIFYAKVRLREPEIYRRMPRIQVSDGFGNTIRSGALGEKDIFLPIRYPLYKYMDLSFRLYNYVLYGSESAPPGANPCSGRNCDPPAAEMFSRLNAVCRKFHERSTLQLGAPEYANLSSQLSFYPGGLSIACIPKRTGAQACESGCEDGNAAHYGGLGRDKIEKELIDHGRENQPFSGVYDVDVTFTDYDDRNRVNENQYNQYKWNANWNFRS